MKLTDGFIGKDLKALEPYLKNAKIAELVEINASHQNELVKKLDDIKKAVQRNGQSSHFIVAMKLQ